MKLIEAIQKTKDLKPSTYDQAHMVEWLSRLDSMVMRHVIGAHEGGEGITFNGYNAETDLETELLVPSPYDEVYLRWLEAQIDYYNGEYGRYNNSMLAFDAVWNNFINDYRKTHVPKARGGSRFVF